MSLLYVRYIDDVFMMWKGTKAELMAFIKEPIGSILGQLFFNTFTNDIFFEIQKSNICNFAVDNTLTLLAKTYKPL